jgi:acetyltransferase
MEKIGKPVALKVVSPEISHKSDVGGVMLNVNDFSQAEKAYEKMNNVNQEKVAGVLVQKMILDGKEVILGSKRDSSFGPILLFGLGGIYVEVLQETSLRIAPINRFEAEEMISELRTAAILKGIRGEPPSDRDALIESLLRLSQLVIDFPEIEGIDINPIKVLEKGAVAVDARILLKSTQA